MESADNPADLVSRGVCAQNLRDNSLWLKGPTWLALPLVPAKKPSLPPDAQVEELVSDNSSSTSLLAATPSAEFAIPTNSKRWGTFGKISLVCIDKISSMLTFDELNAAKEVLLHSLQKSAYGSEIEILKKGTSVPKHSSVFPLSPFLDAEGFIRIKGRLQLSSLSYQAKHPIILPSHWLTKLLVRSQHILIKHAGVNSLLSSLRDTYWIVGVRKLAKGC